jgi:hypothetical protein
MAFSLMAFSIVAFSIMAFTIMAFRLPGACVIKLITAVIYLDSMVKP